MWGGQGEGGVFSSMESLIVMADPREKLRVEGPEVGEMGHEWRKCSFKCRGVFKKLS